LKNKKTFFSYLNLILSFLRFFLLHFDLKFFGLEKNWYLMFIYIQLGQKSIPRLANIWNNQPWNLWYECKHMSYVSQSHVTLIINISQLMFPFQIINNLRRVPVIRIAGYLFTFTWNIYQFSYCWYWVQKVYNWRLKLQL
jgi:hypothetical protein